ncbi:MAG: hypothetical protein FJZ76_08160 [Bacteroidetes bacterium]|nr:hypothetical protein [Bacteroidota bacterium]
MDLKTEIINKSKELHYRCIEVGIQKGIFSNSLSENEKEDRYVDVFDMMPENISSSVLVISINPSSSDLDNNQEPSPCYLHFIPDEIKALRTDLKPILNTWNGDKFGKKLCYPGYFRRIYKIFQNTDYYPLFVNKEYNDNWIKELKKNSKSNNDLLSEEDLFALRALENRSLSKSIIISDLIPLKETKSFKVNLIMNDPEVRKLIIELLEKKIKFLKPDFALIIFKRLQKDLMPNIQSLFSEAGFDDNKLEKSKFIRYMPESELLEIKNKINRVFGIRFPDESLSDKWNYLNS